MSPAIGLVLVLFGVLLFTQTTMGDAVGRLLSYKDPTAAPTTTGRLSSGGSSSRRRGSGGNSAFGGVTYGAGVVKGDPIVEKTIAPAMHAVGGKFRVISWARPGSTVAGSGSPSCHRGGRGSGYGAWDIVPIDDRGRPDWGRADRLVVELKQTARVGEVIFRGDGDHDPKLGADPPHVHAAVNCG